MQTRLFKDTLLDYLNQYTKECLSSEKSGIAAAFKVEQYKKTMIDTTSDEQSLLWIVFQSCQQPEISPRFRQYLISALAEYFKIEKMNDRTLKDLFLLHLDPQFKPNDDTFKKKFNDAFSEPDGPRTLFLYVINDVYLKIDHPQEEKSDYTRSAGDADR